jgi:hypothetical protein
MYLNVHSQYSLRYGTMSVETLVDEALAHGITQMALTDINNSTGAMEFIRTCDEKGLKPIGGIEFRRQKQLLYIGIAQNREGMKELNDFLTEHNLQVKELPDTAPAFKNAFVIYPFSYKSDLKDREYVGLRFDELNKLYGKNLSSVKDKMVVLQPVFVMDKIELYISEKLTTQFRGKLTT